MSKGFIDSGIFTALITYVLKEHSGNAALCMYSFRMPFLAIVPTQDVPFVACHAVLVGLDASMLPIPKAPNADQIARKLVSTSVDATPLPCVPAKREIRRRHHLDEIHVIEISIIRALLRPIKRVDMMICPHLVIIELANRRRRKLWTKPQHVNIMCERMIALVMEVILQIMHMHVSIAEALAGREVKVPVHLVHANAAEDATTFLPLRLEPLGVVHALALLHALAPPKRPTLFRVRLSHFVARIAAAGFFGRRWGWRAVACAAVVRVEVDSIIFVPTS